MSEGNLPVFKARAGGMQVSVWENKGEHGTFKTCSLRRSYKVKEEWKDETINLRVNDIAKAKLVLDLAFRNMAENLDEEKVEE